MTLVVMENQRSMVTRRFVKLLNDYMTKHDCSQQKAASKVGISQNYVSKLLRGERAEITVEILERAIRKLHLHADYFFDEDVEEKGLTYEDFTIYGMRDAMRKAERDPSGSDLHRAPQRTKKAT